MKRSRGLWVTVVIVAVVTALSVAALASGRLQPVLGLDLKGGVSVILSAPDGTPSDTMQQALENIRNRVDAFGVGEPNIALSGNTIEVQIPGLSDSTVQQRSVDLQCIADPKGATYGCASDAKAPTTALQGFEVTSKDTKVCIYAGATSSNASNRSPPRMQRRRGSRLRRRPRRRRRPRPRRPHLPPRPRPRVPRRPRVRARSSAHTA